MSQKGEYSLCLLLFELIVLYASFARSYEGDRCTERNTRGQGVCTRIENCRTAKDYYNVRRIRLETCLFDNSAPIVCCLDGTRFDIYSKPKSGALQTQPAANQRVSQRKCEEYLGSSSRVRRSRRDLHLKVAIVGGIETTIEQLPFMAAIGWTLADGPGFKWLCGGTLISDRYVISAAHCTYAPSTELENAAPSAVALGDKDLRNRQLPTSAGVFAIQSVVTHPSYKSPKKYNDLSLIRTQKSVRFTNQIKPACLWSAESTFAQLTAAGWGTLHDGDRETSNVLMKVDLDVFDSKTCEANFPKSRNWEGFRPNLLCGGYKAGGKDTCQGDSGGPLIHSQTQAAGLRQYIVAVVSFGTRCGAPNGSGVYTKVYDFLDWIERVVWPGEK